MHRKRTRLYAILVSLLLLLTVAFIFSRSMKSVAESSAESQQAMELLQSFLEIFVGPGNVTNHLVRKLAHFCEFGLLGTELGLLILLLGRQSGCWLAFGALPALLVALGDETIQIFSDRGSQVKDVWLDFAGAVCGLLFVFLVRLCIRKGDARGKG